MNQMKRMLAKNCHDQFEARAVLIRSFCIYSAKIIPIFFIDAVCFVQYNTIHMHLVGLGYLLMNLYLTAFNLTLVIRYDSYSYN